MKLLATIFSALLLLAVAHAGKARDWQEATVLAITTGDTGRAIIVPVGPNLVGARIYQTDYHIQTSGLTLVLAARNRKPLNVTVNKKTRIAIDGMKAYLIDDAGHEIKLLVVEKVARSGH